MPLSSAANVARSGILRHSPLIIDIMQREAKLAITERIGSAEKWTPLPVNHTLAAIVAQMTSRVFVGESLCKNPEWVCELYNVLQLFLIHESNSTLI